jgi:WD40 repeat protein
MRVLSTPGHGFGWLCYSRTGRHLLARSRFSPPWWLWDLASGSEGVKLAEDDPRLNLWRLLPQSHGDAFLRGNGYWPDSEEWPVAGELRPEHGKVAEWVGNWYSMISFTHDGKGLLLKRSRPLYGTPDQLAVWSFDEQIQRRFALEDPSWPPEEASFSADGRLVALAFYSRMEVREVKTDKVLIQTPKGLKITVHALSPDARWAAVAAGRVVNTVDVRKRLGAHRFPAFKATVETLAFSPDSRLLAAGSREGRVRLWEVESGRELADLALRKSDVEHLAFSPDGQTLAVACKDKCVVILDVDL